MRHLQYYSLAALRRSSPTQPSHSSSATPFPDGAAPARPLIAVPRVPQAANVLVDARLTAKISDFGFSHTRASTKLYGSPFWMAPEILRGDGRSRFRADVYSFAITAAELLSRRTPFSGLPAGKVLSQVADPAIEPPFRPRLPDAVPRALKELICLCWAHDPSRRPTFEEIGRALEQMPADALSGVFPQDDVGSELGGAGEAALPGAIRAELERPGVKAYQKPMRMLCVMVLTVADATEIAAKLGDGALLENLLSRLFGAVDEEAASVGAVTVMGTGHYVAIVGLNGERDEEQAMRICNLAVRAGTIARDTLVREGFPVMGKVRLRAGVHIAPATAAVVGSRARRFAVLGDAVHVATELEAASQPQRVLLSDAVAMALKRGDPTGLGANVVRHKIVNVRGKVRGAGREAAGPRASAMSSMRTFVGQRGRPGHHHLRHLSGSSVSSSQSPCACIGSNRIWRSVFAGPFADPLAERPGRAERVGVFDRQWGWDPRRRPRCA